MVFNLYYILISILFDIYFSRALHLKLGTSLLVSLFYCIVFFYNSLAKLFLNCFCCLLTVTFCHFWGWDPYSKLSQKTSIFNLGHHWFRRVDGDWAWGFLILCITDGFLDGDVACLHRPRNIWFLGAKNPQY